MNCSDVLYPRESVAKYGYAYNYLKKRTFSFLKVSYYYVKD